MKRSTRFIAWFFVFGVATFSTWQIALIFSYGSHSLAQRNEWTNLKLQGRTGLMGTLEFSTQRQALALDQLNLGEWHGHNEVLCTRSGPWDEIQLDFKIKKLGYLWIFFSQTGSEKIGFRISRSRIFPSGFFKLSNRGEILHREEFEVPFDFGEGTLKIKFILGKLNAFVNENRIYESKQDWRQNQVLSVRSGLQQVSVDNIKFRLGSEVWIENFSPNIFPQYVFLSIGVYGILFTILWFAIVRRSRKKDRVHLTILVQLLFLILIAGYLFIDRKLLSRQYFYGLSTPFNREMLNSSVAKGEDIRKSIFAQINSWLGIQNRQGYELSGTTHADVIQRATAENYKYWPSYQLITSDNKNYLMRDVEELASHSEAGLKINFIGTSQTWGAGARGKTDNWVSATIREMNSILKKPVLGFDQSICGGSIIELLPVYERVIGRWSPDVAVVNLGNNDLRNVPVFTRELRNLILLNRTKGILTVFVLEANDIEFERSRLNITHQLMIDLANEFQIPVLDLHGYLRSPEVYDSGLIWFDLVHFDQFGHDKVAVWMAQHLVKILKSRVPVRNTTIDSRHIEVIQ